MTTRWVARRFRWWSTCLAGSCGYADELEALGDKATISDCVDALIKVLADLHAVDPEAVGLGDFGKPTGYLERQVRRWGSQWDLVRREDDPRRRRCEAAAFGSGTGDSGAEPHLDRARRLPHRQHHARCRRRHARCVAVLDWEMSTLGDPISDAALMCVYRHPMFDMVHASAAWASPLMPSADELAHRYSVVSGQPLAHWEFYMALAYFKLAIIAAGIAFRARMGGVGCARPGGRGGGTAYRRGSRR